MEDREQGQNTLASSDQEQGGAAQMGQGATCLGIMAFALILMFAPIFAPTGEKPFAYIGFVVSFLVVLWSARALILGRDRLAAAAWGLTGIVSGLAVFGLSMALLEADRVWHPRQSHSLNNLKQLAVAVQGYMQDNDGHLPGWGRTPDGRTVHNVWDEQLHPYVRSPHIFRNAAGDGIRSYSDPQRQRVLTYGLNGLLITPKKRSDGAADWSRPEPRRMDDISDPAGTILFAELATEKPMPGVYGRRPDPLSAEGEAQPSDPWRSALDGWIDIDPIAFVETSGPKDSYDEEQWDGKRGIARDLYGGGANYAFADGRVKFMKLAKTVGADQGVQAEKFWANDNPHNMWNPDR